MSALPKLSPMGRAAVGYAEHGWAVFPLEVRGKRPLDKGGFHNASTDTAQVERWWRRSPNANIGLAPGKSGLVVLDVDGPEGERTAAAIGALSEPTLECQTGRAEGGRHRYFRRPPFAVSNCEVGPKLDVRCDGGYVILPPSVHPTGAVYAWHGRADEIAALPDRTVEALQAAQQRETLRVTRVARDGSEGADVFVIGASAREIAMGDAIGEGGRNNALARYAGRLLAKGMADDEVLTLLLAVNATKCSPPLPTDEVAAIVASIAGREARQREARVAAGLPALTVLRPGEPAQPAPAAPTLPTPSEVADEQVSAARELLTRDLTRAPRWAWGDLDRLVGPMLPGEFVVVGSLMGNGKSTLLMSQMHAFAAARMPTLYLPLEVDPSVVRLRWAAWRLGLKPAHVIRQAWEELPEGSRDMVESALEEQAAHPYLHFATPKRVNLPELATWCRWAKEHAGARVVMLDHLHRMDFGADGPSYRVGVTEVVRRLKDMARDLDVVLIAAAQLNRNASDPIDAYVAPGLGRLKESAGIAEEADVALMLSRALRQRLPEKWMQRLRTGEITEADLAEPNVMTITCRKHRLDDAALNRAVRLAVVHGRLEDMAPSYRHADDPTAWYDREVA